MFIGKRDSISSYLGHIISLLGSVHFLFLVIVASLEQSSGKSLIGTTTEIHVLLYVLLQELLCCTEKVNGMEKCVQYFTYGILK